MYQIAIKPFKDSVTYSSLTLIIYPISDTPDAPKNLQIPKYDKRSCELTWEKPDFDGGNLITGNNAKIILIVLLM